MDKLWRGRRIARQLHPARFNDAGILSSVDMRVQPHFMRR
jgi:hypothetical protein